MRRVLRPGLALLALLLSGAVAAAPAPAATGPLANVVGGTATTASAVPWQALVLPTGRLCGGSVLDATHVLTAAHCVVDAITQTATPPATIQVFAGVTDRRDTAAGQSPAVVAVAVDPHYDPTRFIADAAVLTLAAPGFDLSRADIDPIGLTATGWRPAADDDLLLSGWGTTLARSPTAGGNTDPGADVLQEIATLHPSTECAAAYTGYDDTVQLCAGQPGLSACQGDSGGPLAIQLAGAWRLAGIVSAGAGCAWPGYPGIATRVAAAQVHDFITAHTGDGDPSGTDAAAPPPAPVGIADDATTTTTDAAPATPAPVPATPLAAAPRTPAVDTAAPTTTVTVRCAHAACILRVKVADPPPSAGIAGITARVSTAYRTVCGRGRARHRCTKTVGHTLYAITSSSSTTFRVVTPHLRAGLQTFTVIARDLAGHRQAKATTIKARTTA